MTETEQKLQKSGCICRFALGICRRIKKKTKALYQNLSPFMEVPPRFELGNKGFADLCLTTWPWHHDVHHRVGGAGYVKSDKPILFIKRAVDEARTRDLHLGKVALYQLSYYRISAAGRNRTTDT